MTSSVGATGGLHKAQGFSGRSNTEQPVGVNQSDQSPGGDDDDYVPWFQDATQTPEPLDIFDVEPGYNLDSEDDYDFDTETDHDVDAEEDPVEDIEERMLWLWYCDLFRIVRATVIVCYPLIFRGWEVYTAIQLKTCTLFEDEESVIQDIFSLIAVCMILYIMAVCVILVADNAFQIRRKVWAIQDVFNDKWECLREPLLNLHHALD